MSRVTEARERALMDANAERSRKGFSYRVIAELMGIDAAAVGEYLRGERWPNGPNQAKLEAAISWPLGELDRRARKYAKEPAFSSRWVNDEYYRLKLANEMDRAWHRQGRKWGENVNGVEWVNVQAILGAEPHVDMDRVTRLAAALGVEIDPAIKLPKSG